MFKPLKYQKGGTAASQEQLVQLFQAAAENAQVDPEQLVQKASEIGQDEEAAARFMQGLQLCAQGDPEGIQFIKSLFQSPAFKKGGKIFEFICKHAKGGYVSGCGCGGNVKKAQEGTQFKAPTNYYNEKGWQISENNALRRNNRTFYTEEPTTAGNVAWANNQMSNQLMWPGIIQDVQYNQPVGHYVDEYGNMHNFSVEGNDLTKYNNRKAQWKKCGGKVKKGQYGVLLPEKENKPGYRKETDIFKDGTIAATGEYANGISRQTLFPGTDREWVWLSDGQNTYEPQSQKERGRNLPNIHYMPQREWDWEMQKMDFARNYGTLPNYRTDYIRPEEK